MKPDEEIAYLKKTNEKLIKEIEFLKGIIMQIKTSVDVDITNKIHVQNDEILNRRIEDLPFSTKIKHILHPWNSTRIGYATVKDLIQATELDLLRTRGLGQKSIDAIKTFLAQYGLSLGTKI